MRKNIFYSGLLLIIFCFGFGGSLFADNGEKLKLSVFDRFKHASVPTKTFSTPTGKVLNSLEIMVIMGSSFGIEESNGFLGKIAVGLGGIAEVEFTRSSFMDNLTGKQKNLPTSVFKMSIIPQRFTRYWFVPFVSLQLHSTPWSSNVDPASKLQSEVKADYMEMNLSRMNMENRFTTLYGIVGKEIGFISLHGGLTLTDVRVRNGYQWIYHQDLGYDVYETIPDMQKNLIAPFGNVTILANEDTRLMAELQAIPFMDYNIKSQQVEIKKTWRAIVGVRFFVTPWISLDTGVKYLSSAKGIADSEVNAGINFVIPVKNLIRNEEKQINKTGAL